LKDLWLLCFNITLFYIFLPLCRLKIFSFRKYCKLIVYISAACACDWLALYKHVLIRVRAIAQKLIVDMGWQCDSF